MLRVALALLSVASAAGIPVDLPFLSGGECTGTDAPKHTPPYCYSGKKSVLGGAFSEGVTAKVTSYDSGTKKGTMDIHATGVSPESCGNISFTKSGQKIDFGGKLACLGKVTVDSQYCSDQDIILLHVAIPHFPMPSITVTMNKTDCP